MISWLVNPSDPPMQSLRQSLRQSIIETVHKMDDRQTNEIFYGMKEAVRVSSEKDWSINHLDQTMGSNQSITKGNNKINYEKSSKKDTFDWIKSMSLFTRCVVSACLEKESAVSYNNTYSVGFDNTHTTWCEHINYFLCTWMSSTSAFFIWYQCDDQLKNALRARRWW